MSSFFSIERGMEPIHYFEERPKHCPFLFSNLIYSANRVLL